MFVSYHVISFPVNKIRVTHLAEQRRCYMARILTEDEKKARRELRARRASIAVRGLQSKLMRELWQDEDFREAITRAQKAAKNGAK